MVTMVTNQGLYVKCFYPHSHEMRVAKKTLTDPVKLLFFLAIPSTALEELL